MNDPLPDHLREVRKILMDSAQGPGDDDPPIPPDDLLDELEDSLTGVPTPKKASPPPFFQRLRKVFASPAFGLVAALVVVLFIAVPLISPDNNFRNTGGETSDGAAVVFIGIDDATFEALRANHPFDPEALNRVTTRDQAAEIPAPKIVVDFTEKQIRAIDASGREVHAQAFSNEDLVADIALALSKVDLADPDR